MNTLQGPPQYQINTYGWVAQGHYRFAANLESSLPDFSEKKQPGILSEINRYRDLADRYMLTPHDSIVRDSVGMF
jgi:hypothetical protein